MDVGAPVRGPQHLLLGQRAQRPVDRLEQQLRALAGLERALERLDQADRVLALDRAQVVVDEQEQEPILGQAQPLGRGRLGGRLHGRRQRNRGHRRHGADVLRHEPRVDPDLLNERERAPPARRDRVDLPAPDADLRSLEVVISQALNEVGELFGVDRDDLKVVVIPRATMSSNPCRPYSSASSIGSARWCRGTLTVLTGTPAAPSACA